MDSYGGYRASFNANQPIWKDKLGLRVAAVYANNAYEQKPSYDDVKRIYGALNFKPFAKTTIKFKSEVYHEERQTPNSLTPRDGVSEWVAAGKPVWNPVTWTATLGDGTTKVIPFTSTENTTLPAGLYANSTVYTRPNMYIDNGVVQLWEVNRLSTNNTNGTLNSNPNNNVNSNARVEAAPDRPSAIIIASPQFPPPMRRMGAACRARAKRSASGSFQTTANRAEESTITAGRRFRHSQRSRRRYGGPVWGVSPSPARAPALAG